MRNRYPSLPSLLLVLAAGASIGIAQRDSPPNIVLVMTDD